MNAITFEPSDNERERKLRAALIEFIRVENNFGHTGQHKETECADCKRVIAANDALSCGYAVSKLSLGFEELSRELTHAPKTWLPALLQRLSRTCSTKPVFKDKEAFLAFASRSWDMKGVGDAEMRSMADNLETPPKPTAEVCTRCGEPDPCACEPATQGKVF